MVALELGRVAEVVMLLEAPQSIAAMEVAVIVEVELDLILSVLQLLAVLQEMYVFPVSKAADLVSPVFLEPQEHLFSIYRFQVVVRSPVHRVFFPVSIQAMIHFFHEVVAT